MIVNKFKNCLIDPQKDLYKVFHPTGGKYIAISVPGGLSRSNFNRFSKIRLTTSRPQNVQAAKNFDQIF